MTTQPPDSELCKSVADAALELLRGEATDPLYAHLSDCGDCRDLLHALEALGAHVTAAASDYVAVDFTSGLLEVLVLESTPKTTTVDAATEASAGVTEASAVATEEPAASSGVPANAHASPRPRIAAELRSALFAAGAVLLVVLLGLWLKGPSKNTRQQLATTGTSDSRASDHGADSALGRTSEAVIAESDEPQLRSLGELKAKRPGSDTERDTALSLDEHRVRVRIAGLMARTEVEEVFTNHTRETLEGIFRFPIPAQAKIESLALDVDGRWVEGAFVEREQASKIWRGAITQGTPKQLRRRDEEIIWVPGPWKDPALLEWQRGARFELRIYPIPGNGSRKIKLSYTEQLPRVGESRRYTYPLAHDPAGTTQVKHFTFDAEVRGFREPADVSAKGYPFESQRDRSEAKEHFERSNFEPEGDIQLDFVPADENSELSAWTFAAPAQASLAPSAGVSGQGYAALSLRPELPSHTGARSRVFGIIIDSSRSMFGESYRRSVNVAAQLVEALAPEDALLVLACDTSCRLDPRGVQPGGREAASALRAFLAPIVPEGASDVAHAIETASRTLATREPHKLLQLVYIGDGAPTVGPVHAATLKAALRHSLQGRQAALTTVGVGADADTETLRALAVAGGGVFLPHVPGKNQRELASAILAATRDAVLRRPSVTLPAGLEAISPSELEAIAAGNEVVVAARMTQSTVAGDVVLRGELAGETFERRYPLKLELSSAPGNAFVSRLYASLRLADLESSRATQAKAESIELSRRFNVASRHTSLLVLESAAMFRAFGLDNRRAAEHWSGEVAPEEANRELDATSDASFDEQAAASDALGSGAPAKRRARSAEGLGSAASESKGDRAKSAASFDEFEGRDDRASPFTPAPAAKKPAPADPAPNGPPFSSEPSELERWPLSPFAVPPPERESPRPQRLIPMRRIWVRSGSIDASSTLPKAVGDTALSAARAAFESNENSRAHVSRLFVLTMRAGLIAEAAELAEHWSDKQPLDPDALTARADVAARLGQRALAIRILGSVLDVRPGDSSALRRLARLKRWSGLTDEACRFTLAAAETSSADPKLHAEAVRCSQASGASWFPEILRSSLTPSAAGLLAAELARATTAESLSGDLRVELRWDGASDDLDIGMIHPDGHRISWLGAPSRSVISALNVVSEREESLALRGAEPGEYVVEVVRSDVSANASPLEPVRGVLTLRVVNARQSIPFTLTGNALSLAVAKIALKPQLVEVPIRATLIE